MKNRTNKPYCLLILFAFLSACTCIWLLYYFLSFASPSLAYLGDYKMITLHFETMLQQFSIYIFAFLLAFFYLIVLLTYEMGKHQNKHYLQLLMQDEEYQNEDLSKTDRKIINVFQQQKRQGIEQIEDMKRFQAYVSHEQKNELAILKTLLSQHEDTQITSSIMRIQDSLDDILTLNDVVDTVELIDCAAICAAMFDYYKKTYTNIIFCYDENANTYIFGKERWIRRAIANLIHNAIKFGLQKQIEVHVESHKGSVQISISDHGIGMDETYAQKVMQYGYRLSQINSDGYGIGLNLVRHVCQLSKGFIWIRCKPQQGTTVILSFPQACK